MRVLDPPVHPSSPAPPLISAHLLRTQDNALFEKLLDLITKATIEYMSAQIDAGAEVMKIFDSWAGSLPGDAFEKYALAPAREITQELKKRHPGIPIIGFPREAGDKYIGFAKATAGMRMPRGSA